MMRVLRVSLSAAAGLAFLMLAAPSQAGQAGAFGFTTSSAEKSGYTVRNPRLVQIASHLNSQTANVPVGTIRLRVIPEIGGKAMRDPIHWRVMTYGKDSNGKRHQVAEVTDSTPEISLPAGWYVVHAKVRGKTIKHPVEVTAGKTFKYTLVK